MSHYEYTFPIYKVAFDSGAEPKEVDGRILLAYFKCFQMVYSLGPVGVYQDGTISCNGSIVDFEEFKRRVRSGSIQTSLPDGAEVEIPNLGRFNVASPVCFAEPEEFIKEVADDIEALNKRPASWKICQVAYQKYLADPTDDTRAKLRLAYEAIPAHHRKYVLGDMDNKDAAIRFVIYGRE